jgi:hypothetical protein
MKKLVKESLSGYVVNNSYPKVNTYASQLIDIIEIEIKNLGLDKKLNEEELYNLYVELEQWALEQQETYDTGW